MIRPTVSVIMPIYTGGLTRSAKEIANIQVGRSQLSNKQQQDTQRFELIQSYFNVQLQKQLHAAALFNLNAMQQHYRNALKMEQQGFISKGQRMQFEVARNNAERSQQNTQANLNAALFQLNNLLQESSITELSTPLFVNKTEPQALNHLLKTFSQNSALIQKMQLDTQLAQANVKAQQAAKNQMYLLLANIVWIKMKTGLSGLPHAITCFPGSIKTRIFRLPNSNALQQNCLLHAPSRKLKI